MTQQEKQLLLIDLCARLQHGVDLQINKKVTERLYSIVKNRNTEVWFVNGVNVDLIEIKPYLRPMSSMTEEEKREYFDVTQVSNHCAAIDWLNSHHFDYRGLITLGWAIEAPEGMYK